MLIGAMLSHPPRKPSTLVADVPPELDRIFARCLAVRPQHRFADVAELIEAFDALERVEPAGRRSSWLAPATTISDLDDDSATMICTTADTFGAAAAPGLALASSEARMVAIPMPRPHSRAARGSSPIPMRPPIIVTSYAGLLRAPRLVPPTELPAPRRWRVVAAVAAISLAFGIALALAL
jgi:hypothetical protein